LFQLIRALSERRPPIYSFTTTHLISLAANSSVLSDFEMRVRAASRHAIPAKGQRFRSQQDFVDPKQ
jgi:hypothetical protein